MAVYFAVGTPTDDGRIQDFRLIPPPGTEEGQVLLWNQTDQQPEWKSLAAVILELGITVPGGGGTAVYGPIATDTGQWLVTDTGARLVGLIV